MYCAYAASYTMIEPLARAKATRCFNCSRVAAAPVGLLGEQKNIRSVRFTCALQVM